MTDAHVLNMIETSGPGGAERVLINIAGTLMRDPGFRSSAILQREGWVATELRAQGIEPRFLQLRHMLDLGFVRRVVSQVKREQVGLIHAHEFGMNVHGALIARLAGIPAIATVHGRTYYGDNTRRILAMRALRRLGATVVAVSADIRDLLEQLGVRDVRVIANGIDLSVYENVDALPREALGLPADAKVIGAVGNLYEVKGHRVLVEALAACGRSDLHAVIAGRGDEEEPLRRLAEERHVADRVHLLGFRSDVPALLKTFDVYTLPSFSEGQSLALMEAMAASSAIVATDVGGNSEIVRTGREGVLVPAGDPEALARAIERLVDSPEEGTRYGEAAHARARAEFSLDAMIAAYRALYRERGVTD